MQNNRNQKGILYQVIFSLNCMPTSLCDWNIYSWNYFRLKWKLPLHKQGTTGLLCSAFWGLQFYFNTKREHTMSHRLCYLNEKPESFDWLFTYNETSHLRRKGWVQLSSKVVGVQYEHPNHKCKKYHNKKDHKLEDVLNSPSEGDLQGPKTLICRQDVGDPRKAENNSNCIKAFRYYLRIRWEPFISSWKIWNTGVTQLSQSWGIHLDRIFPLTCLNLVETNIWRVAALFLFHLSHKLGVWVTLPSVRRKETWRNMTCSSAVCILIWTRQ